MQRESNDFLDLGESFAYIKHRGTLVDSFIGPRIVPLDAREGFASFYTTFPNITRMLQITLHRHILNFPSYTRFCRHPTSLSTPSAHSSNHAAISEASVARVGDGKALYMTLLL
jgi:hypothetical protein